MISLSRQRWNALAEAHDRRARQWVEPHLARRSRGEKHPIWDFLFDYYPVRPTHLTRWHPGLGTELIDASDAPHTSWRDYQLNPDGTVALDLDSFLAHRRSDMENIRALLNAIGDNRPQFDCFGLHEWAMVYETQKPRHDIPLRLGREGTNDVVKQHDLKCTHFDAYRFFTAPAKPLNLTVLDSNTRHAHDQCGCLHVGMDLYKWATKMGPIVPGELMLDCLELAMDIRLLDMEASPYDCQTLGYGVVPIETPEGKAEYVARQRELSVRAEPLRHRLLVFLDAALTG
nr:Uncharacterised protein [Streptococcus thermophilus]